MINQFVDEQGQNLNRFTMTPVTGQENVYDITRNATITQQGTPVNADVMNQIVDEVNGHVADTDIHVTAQDKQNWNKAAEVDYIVEQDTSGIWTYRKWNSGIAECWGTKLYSKSMTTAWGSLYSTGALGSVSYPFTFIETPVESVTVSQRSGATCFLVSEGSGNASTTQTADYSAVRATSDATVRTLVLNYRVIGRWK